MRYFRFRNWDKAQHYNEPNPPWAKLYARILDHDNDWYDLTDAQAGQLARLIALACRTGNAMPFDNDVIQEEIHASSEVRLSVFVKIGIVEVLPSKAKCVELEALRISTTRNSRGKSREKSSQNAVLRDQSSEFREQTSEEELQNPPTPRKRGGVVGGKGGNREAEIRSVVDHLNRTTGRKFSHDTAVDEIAGRLADGASVVDCQMVIDHVWIAWQHDARVQSHVDKTTPFRKRAFARYLDAAKAGGPRSGSGRQYQEMPEVDS